MHEQPVADTGSCSEEIGVTIGGTDAKPVAVVAKGKRTIRSVPLR